jgi:outer membrane protein OmpA-like peptidoglycan-associated protein/tetratricopeptide (TPR) repeat protein
MRTFLFVLIFSLSGIVGFGQGTTSIADVTNIFDEKGDYYYDKKEYKKAITYYNMAYKKDNKNYYSILRKAEAFTVLEQYAQAAECYQIIFNSDLKIPNVYRLRYALVLLKIGDIVKFENWLTQYNAVVESEIEGQNYISTSDDRAKLYKDSTIIIVDHIPLINSSASEINPVAIDGQVLFSSNRTINKEANLDKSYNVFVSNFTKQGMLGAADIFNKSLNSILNESSPYFFDITNTLYFSRSEGYNRGFKTYSSGIPYEANEALETSNFSIGSFDNIGQLTMNSNGTKLYFTSDVEGGQGGFDLYSSDLINGEWSDPRNLGPRINTSGNELNPSLLNDSILYFSSQGHNSIGGFDLFRINLNDPTSIAENLGSKVNTEYDELGLSFAPGDLTAYFSSNRPGGKGKEDIYRLHLLDLKVKYAAYRHKRRGKIQEGKINLYLSNGDEYNIGSKENTGFNFSFLPEEPYKMIIQHENPTAENAFRSKTLTPGQKSKELLQPTPLDKAEIPLEAGMKYQFTAGLNPIDPSYLNYLEEVADDYQDPKTSTIDLTALAKELQFTEGEIYTIRFVKDKDKVTGYKQKGESRLFIDNEEISIYGRAFFIVLPLDNEVNFNIQTDIDHLKDNFNPKKHGIVVETGPVFDPSSKWLVSMTVNTESTENVIKENQLTAEEISIIPGTEYIITLGKVDPASGEKIEIIIPLTRGVKYNLGTAANSQDAFRLAFAQMVLGRDDLEPADEELIDISILSKELEIQPGEDITFNLLPAMKFGKKAIVEDAKSILSLDGMDYAISKEEMYTINVPFGTSQSLNIQTDIDYVIENFELEQIVMALDTLPFFGAITIDTTGLSTASPDWLSVSVNTSSKEEVEEKNQFVANELSIIPGKEYILTVTKIDAITGKETEIIVPLTRKVKYDFTSDPISAEAYKQSFEAFLENNEQFETTGGELIDISMISKELEIEEGDEISFSLLPAKIFKDGKVITESSRSSLFLDSKVVEFTQIQKYSINVPLNDQQVNLQTNIEHIQDNFEAGTYSLDVDTLSFFSEITVDTTGYGYMVIPESEITDPVYDVVVVNFDLNDYSLRPKAVYTIDGKVVEELKKDNRLYVTIKGYTDGLGNTEYNLELSKKRAHSVKDYLQAMGIGESRIRTFSFGDSHTLKEGVNWEDLSEEELEKHRKVEIVIYLPE